MSNLEMFVRALDSIRTHLTEHPVDTKIASVTADAFDGGLIDVHLARCELAELASGLLAWADTLTTAFPSALRRRYTNELRLRITGQLPDSTWIDIYGTVTNADTAIGADFPPGELQHIFLDDLRFWAVAP
jgi:hypothetical protein